MNCSRCRYPPTPRRPPFVQMVPSAHGSSITHPHVPAASQETPADCCKIQPPRLIRVLINANENRDTLARLAWFFFKGSV
jgi:hypothetical protein